MSEPELEKEVAVVVIAKEGCCCSAGKEKTPNGAALLMDDGEVEGDSRPRFLVEPSK